MLLLILPAISAFLYAVSVLFFKKLSGIGPWRLTFLCNSAIAMVFAPLLFWGKGAIPWNEIYYPIICGAIFFLGQICVFFSIHRGDVSIATPVLGTKIVLVTVLASLIFKEDIPSAWWLSAALATLGVILLGISRPEHRERTLITLLYGSLAALCYALADVLIPHWVHHWHVAHFIPLMFITVFLLSFSLIPFFSHPLREIPKWEWKWIASACFLNALQSMLVALSIAITGLAAPVNIVYGSRGLWTIILIALCGHWLGIHEVHVSRPIFWSRVIGAIILLSALVFLFV